MSITFDGVGEIEHALAQLTAQRVGSSLGEDHASTRYVVVKHVSVPHLEPQRLAQLHRSKVVSHIPQRVVVVHHRLGLLVHAVVEDLHVRVRFGDAVRPQARRSVDLQAEGAPAGPQGTAVVVQVGSRGAAVGTGPVLLQLVILYILCDGALQVSADPGVLHQVVQREDGVRHHVGVVVQAAHPVLVRFRWVLLVEDVGEIPLPTDDLNLMGHEALVEPHAHVTLQ